MSQQDGDMPIDVADEALLDAAGGDSSVRGVMYTTWEHRFDDLEAFAGAAWGWKPPRRP